MSKVLFYFDPISPYAWLASRQLPLIEEKTSAEFEFIPVLFAGLLNAHGQLGPAEIPTKRELTIKDAMRWAVRLGLPFEGPPAHPFNPLKALRLCTAVKETQIRNKLAIALLDAAWMEGKDLTDSKVLGECLESCNLTASKILPLIEDQSVKDSLRKNTEEAINKGVFGVPTFIVNGELFWGNDRLPFVCDEILGKNKLDPDKVRTVLNRPRGADRSKKP